SETEDPEAASRRERRDRLQSLLGRAAGYYTRYLWEGREALPARQYLLGRGFGEQTLREFRVGYAPSAWDRMLLASRKAGFSDEELLAVGLAQRSRSRPGQIFDRFRQRIMFPSCDARGKVLGFGARAMRENQPPKYLNTSEGEIYHKRSQLFGIDRARSEAARAGRMILVEGYTDVLALHQAGLGNAVGIMGTALTEEQVGELERIVKVLELCLDADRAGQDAMLRASRLAAGRKLELRVVPLPEGTDPAELIGRDGAEALRARVESSVPFVVFHVERILDRGDVRSAEGRDRALGELQPLLAAMPPSVLRDDLVQRVAGRLELSEGRLATLVTGAGGSAASPAAGNGSSSAAAARAALPAVDQEIRAERAFLALCIALPPDGQAVLSAIDPDELLLSGLMRRVARHLINRTDTPLSDLPPDDEELARAVAGLVALAGRGTDGSPAQLEHARLVLELGRLDRAIRRARGTGGGDVTALARQREHALEELRAVVARLERPL
ncbi:MAG: toprim domain-containing protein, partial [Solirubrobacteraceae bacterium]